MSSGFTDRYRRIVTVAATVGRLCVIKRQDDRRPNVGGMTGIALFGRHRMDGGLVSTRTDTIVTAGTVTGLPRYGAVIKNDL